MPLFSGRRSGPTRYSAFALDRNANNIEAVYDWPVALAESVVIEFEP
jgi:hypothetical protein